MFEKLKFFFFKILNNHDNKISTVNSNVTQQYYHKWTCETPFNPTNNFCFRVHSCFALQKLNTLESLQRIPILDENGCVLLKNKKLIGALKYYNEYDSINKKNFKRVAGIYANHIEPYEFNIYFQCQIRVWHKEDFAFCNKTLDCLTENTNNLTSQYYQGTLIKTG